MFGFTTLFSVLFVRLTPLGEDYDDYVQPRICEDGVREDGED